MRIAITGHTRGIGQKTFEMMVKRGHECVGFSRSNGFDLEHWHRIGDEILAGHFDILFNNAWHEFGQAKLLKQVSQGWHGSDNLILTNGSLAADYLYRKTDEGESYTLSKRYLEDLHNRLSAQSPCRLSLIKFGRVNTPLTKQKTGVMLSLDDAADCLVWMMEQPKSWMIQSLTLKKFEFSQI